MIDFEKSERKTMTKMSCNRCGRALTKGARFCTSCGATTTSAETFDISSPETRPFVGEQTDQIVPRHSAATEDFSSNQKVTQIVTPLAAQPEASSYDTEEMPRTKITSQAEERSTTSPTEGAVTQAQIKSPPVIQPSRRRKGPLLATALGIVVLGVGSFFFINSRRASETQAANKSVDEAKPAASAQPSIEPSIEPSGQPSPATANNQTQPPSEQQAEGVKSQLTKNAAADAKSSQHAVAKPTPASPKEKNDAEGTGAAAYNYNQGITYFNAGRYQDALREFEYVKKLDPGNKSVYYLIGQAYLKLGQLEPALDAFRRCTSGQYVTVASNNAKALEKRLGKTN